MWLRLFKEKNVWSLHQVSHLEQQELPAVKRGVWSGSRGRKQGLSVATSMSCVVAPFPFSCKFPQESDSQNPGGGVSRTYCTKQMDTRGTQWYLGKYEAKSKAFMC